MNYEKKKLPVDNAIGPQMVPIEDYIKLERELELWKELYNNLLKRVSELRDIVAKFSEANQE